jgi:hypothetical protein
MLKRICIYLAAIPIFFGAVYGYQWYKFRPVRLAARREVAGYIAQNKALEDLGDVQLDTTELTFARLEERLHKHSVRLVWPHYKNGSRLGWACKQDDCLIWAWFATPPAEEIGGNDVPAALMISNPWGGLFGSKQHISVDGAYLGEPVEQLKQSVKNRGYGVDNGIHKITWNKEWDLQIVELQGKVSFLYFLNEPFLQRADIEGKTPVPQKIQ